MIERRAFSQAPPQPPQKVATTLEKLLLQELCEGEPRESQRRRRRVHGFRDVHTHQSAAASLSRREKSCKVSQQLRPRPQNLPQTPVQALWGSREAVQSLQELLRNIWTLVHSSAHLKKQTEVD